MKLKKKLAFILAVITMVLGSFQPLFAKDYKPISMPIPSSRKDYTPIPIFIPGTKGEKNFDLKPQPGFDVTLLMNQTVHFAWSDSNAKKNFVIKDSKGKKVFETGISGKNSIDILPSEIKGLKAGKKYSWSVDGGLNVFEFTILDEKTEKQLRDNLAEIDAENLSPDECIVEKAVYLQMLSDKYPDSFDLYWLIAQQLSSISPADEKLKEKKNELLERCIIHFNAEMR